MIDFRPATETLMLHEEYDGRIVSFGDSAKQQFANVIGVTISNDTPMLLIDFSLSDNRYSLLDPKLVQVTVIESEHSLKSDTVRNVSGEDIEGGEVVSIVGSQTVDHSSTCSFKPDESDGNASCDCKGTKGGKILVISTPNQESTVQGIFNKGQEGIDALQALTSFSPEQAEKAKDDWQKHVVCTPKPPEPKDPHA